jgi:hypothetical protein
MLLHLNFSSSSPSKIPAPSPLTISLPFPSSPSSSSSSTTSILQPVILFVLGRSSKKLPRSTMTSKAIVIDDAQISSVQCAALFHRGKIYLADAGSSNGTRISHGEGGFVTTLKNARSSTSQNFSTEEEAAKMAIALLPNAVLCRNNPTKVMVGEFISFLMTITDQENVLYISSSPMKEEEEEEVKLKPKTTITNSKSSSTTMVLDTAKPNVSKKRRSSETLGGVKKSQKTLKQTTLSMSIPFIPPQFIGRAPRWALTGEFDNTDATRMLGSEYTRSYHTTIDDGGISASMFIPTSDEDAEEQEINKDHLVKTFVKLRHGLQKDPTLPLVTYPPPLHRTSFPPRTSLLLPPPPLPPSLVHFNVLEKRGEDQSILHIDDKKNDNNDDKDAADAVVVDDDDNNDEEEELNFDGFIHLTSQSDNIPSSISNKEKMPTRLSIDPIKKVHDLSNSHPLPHSSHSHSHLLPTTSTTTTTTTTLHSTSSTSLLHSSSSSSSSSLDSCRACSVPTEIATAWHQFADSMKKNRSMLSTSSMTRLFLSRKKVPITLAAPSKPQIDGAKLSSQPMLTEEAAAEDLPIVSRWKTPHTALITTTTTSSSSLSPKHMTSLSMEPIELLSPDDKVLKSDDKTASQVFAGIIEEVNIQPSASKTTSAIHDIDDVDDDELMLSKVEHEIVMEEVKEVKEVEIEEPKENHHGMEDEDNNAVSIPINTTIEPCVSEIESLSLLIQNDRILRLRALSLKPLSVLELKEICFEKGHVIINEDVIRKICKILNVACE